MRTERSSGLLHPIALASIAVLLVNDHVLKGNAPGWITGKLSDVAGLVFFPLLVAALVRFVVDFDRLVAVCAAATAIGFAAVKLWEPARIAASYVLGALQNPLHVQPVVIVPDATDLIALPAVLVAVAIYAHTCAMERACSTTASLESQAHRHAERRALLAERGDIEHHGQP